SLYNIYKRLCDYIHDGYYNQILEMTDKNQSDSKENITLEETMIISVSNSFYESYKTIMK
ncbi:hypothetical protein, partial [Clostridium luticellarii]|uniref:hypothetical protein n=1 Tax=Clostridium luticellarii TaxID=1691940 RepID=UPI001A9A5291